MRPAFLIPLLLSVAAMALQSPAPTSVPANELVQRVITNELKADQQDHSHWMYRCVTNAPAPAKKKTVVQTKNGDVNYVEEIDGHPLTPQQRSAEDEKIRKFISDPDEQRKARRDGAADDRKSTELMAMLPDAFIFQYAGTSGESAGSSGGNVKLAFHPNPEFTSHSSEAYVFHKMDGFVIVNTKEDRLVEISGTLTNGVEFGGGLFGHLDPGGAFDVRREEVAPGLWAITKIKVDMNGKILFFKTIAEKQDEVHTHFQRVPDDTTMEQAEAMAQKQAVALATPGN
jgi:hypothetical protein